MFFNSHINIKEDFFLLFRKQYLYTLEEGGGGHARILKLENWNFSLC